jgi:hypothetical protein
LHIGSTKTGSSALQKILYSNRDALQKAGVYYPDIGVASNAHHVLLGAIHPGAWNLHKDAYKDDRIEYFKERVAAIIARAEELECRHIVLSSEYLWGEFNPRVYKLIRDAFAECQLRIFASLRDPAHWAESTYLQVLKRGESKAFAEWLEKTRTIPVRGFDFDAVVKKWSEGTHAACTTLMRYEFDSEAEFMSQVFFEMTGVDLNDMPVRTVTRTVNPSPTQEGMRMMLKLNRSDLPDKEREKKMEKILSTHSRPPNSRKLYFPKKH